MHLALFLHIYQPPTQYQETLKFITQRSYERIVACVEEFPDAKMTLNINASLTQQLAEAGFRDFLLKLGALGERGQIEFSGSAAYHPILPDLPKREIVRQIKLNTEINKSLIGSAYDPSGFFPPELAYDNRLGEVVERLGFSWLMVDGTAIPDHPRALDFVYRKNRSRLLVFVREDDVSFRIAFGMIRTLLGLKRRVGASDWGKRKYMVLAMDGETFGHYRPGLLRFLRQLFRASKEDPRFRLVTVSEIAKIYPKHKSVALTSSTWGYTQEIEGKKVWVRWRNPDNPVHLLLSELRSLAISTVKFSDSEARRILDKAMNSDTFWWASASPCWHPGMVERGARMLMEAVMESKYATLDQKQKARDLYSQVMETGIAIFGKRRRAC
jgi:alpha-amylase/alpha-mannosidase (GH57 family)